MDKSKVEITSRGVNNVTINVDGKNINDHITAIDIKISPNSLPQIILTIRPIDFQFKGEAEIIERRHFARDELGRIKERR
ncbi:MAG: hypothetical protein K1W18_11515 [Oscillospiraceae bacterium]